MTLANRPYPPLRQAQVVVGYDQDKSRFTVKCPIWANDLLHDIPGKRWNKKDRVWVVPRIRLGVDGVRRLSKMAGTELLPEAVAALESYEEKRVEAAKRGVFPAWYKFKTEPRKHQYAALEKLYPLPAGAAFMDMQTGKSKVAIDIAAARRMEGLVNAMLIVCKLSLRRNWIRQLNTHCPLPVSIHLPYTDEEREFTNWLVQPHDFKVCIVGFESLSAGRMRLLAEKFLLHMRRSMMVVDESTYIAGHDALRSEECVKLGRMAEYRMAMTGTPIPDGPLNLFMQFEFLDPEIIGIGDYYAFRNRYAIVLDKETRDGKSFKMVVGYRNVEELSKTVAPYVFQMFKKDAYDLPPKRYQLRTVTLTRDQRKLYDMILHENAFRFKDAEHVIKNVLELGLRLHQVAGGYTVKPYLDRHGNQKYEPVEVVTPAKNPKVIEIQSIVEEMGKRQGIIWCVYRPEIAAVVWALKRMGKRIGELHGGVPEQNRQSIVDGFEKGDYDFIVGNAATGGMGYTMMTAEGAIFYNNTFKLIDRLQSEDRIWGDGQTKSVMITNVEAEGTIDSTISAAVEEKVNLADYIRKRIGDAIKLLSGVEPAGQG